MDFVARVLKVRKNEVPLAVWSFILFFLIFSSFTLLRPLREVMGIASGIDSLQWLFLACFITTLLLHIPYSFLASKVRKEHILSAVYAFFILNMAAFGGVLYLDETSIWTGRIFYVWLSVFNLEIVSLGFSFLNDILNSAQSRRLFAIAAAGSSLGSIAGPSAAALLALYAPAYLSFAISSLLLFTALLTVRHIRLYCIAKESPAPSSKGTDSIKASRGSLLISPDLLSGIVATFKNRYLIGNALYILLASATTTALYFLLMRSVNEYFHDRSEQALVFSLLDLTVNTATIILQIFVTGRIAQSMGVKPLISVLPVVIAIGFMIYMLSPSFAVVAAVMTLRRIGQYALVKPGKEMLFNVLTTDEKYKAKNFIDTAVYRLGDLLSAFVSTALTSTLGLLGGAALGIVLSALWGGLGHSLGNAYSRLERKETSKEEPD